jgi:hypothetical protein
MSRLIMNKDNVFSVEVMLELKQLESICEHRKNVSFCLDDFASHDVPDSEQTREGNCLAQFHFETLNSTFVKIILSSNQRRSRKILSKLWLW